MAIDKRLFRVTKKGTAYRGKRQKGNNYDEKRGAVGFRGNSQAGANCQENDFVAIDGGARRVTKKQTDFRDNRLDPSRLHWEIESFTFSNRLSSHNVCFDSTVGYIKGRDDIRRPC